MNPKLNPVLRHVAAFSLLVLLLLCVAWELFLAPIRPGGSWFFLKALPLACAVRGVACGNLYTFQWASMLVLLYLMEGVVRAMSDSSSTSVMLAWAEIVLSTLFFFSAIFYVHPSKKVAQRQVK